MSIGILVRLAAVSAVTAVVTLLLARLAPRLGWMDAPRGAEAARKRQGRPVPPVGGAALLLGLVWTPWSEWGPGWGWPASLAAQDGAWGPWLPATGWCLAALALVFLVGTWDDRVGLGPGPKAVAQLVALAPIGAGAWLAHGPLPALALVAVGLLALNALNTFDNADGALASLGVLGFASALPLVSAACLGFLPCNLDAGRTRHRASGAPTAYLGDAGAFVLAWFVLCVPRAAGILVLPLLDLARLAWLRGRAGSRPWIGDRRHLAHRLEARGLARPVVALLQCLIAAPACVWVGPALAEGDLRRAAGGCVLCVGLFTLALRLAPARLASS